MTGREPHWKWNGEDVSAHLEIADGSGTISVGGRTIPFQILDRSAHGIRVFLEGKNYELFTSREGSIQTVWCEGAVYRLEPFAKGLAPHAESKAASDEIRAPMAGKVARV